MASEDGKALTPRTVRCVSVNLSGRPLLDTGPDAKLYIDRGHLLERVSRAAEDGLNVLVLGERGAGKTSLLRQAAAKLREAGKIAVFADVALGEDASEVLELIRRALRIPAPTTPFPPLLVHRAVPPSDSVQLLSAVRDLGRGEEAVVLVDGLPSARVAHTIFGRLRDELWQLPYTWVVSADQRDEATLLSPPADAFFDLRVELSPLSKEQAMELLRRRLEDKESVDLKALVESTDRTPRQVIDIARDVLVFDRPVSDVREGLVWLQTEASKLGRTASMMIEVLRQRGPTSASDLEFLQSLGLTRTRATQVLRELEEAGLVSATYEGRRKLYTVLTEPGEEHGRS